MKTRLHLTNSRAWYWAKKTPTALACLVAVLSTFASGRLHAQSEPPTFERAPNPAAAGLWMGDITLFEVTYPPTAAVEPTQERARMRILLHVDSSGKVRLLKDAIIAARAGTDSEQLVITKASLLATLPVARSNPFNAPTAQRFSTVAFDFTDNDANPNDAALELEGGLGEHRECAGAVLLDKSHPTNPFRHKFHPDHANDGAKAYTITRNLKAQFLGGIENSNGVDRLNGTYEELITGLNSATLTIRGALQLTRVSNASALNQ